MTYDIRLFAPAARAVSVLQLQSAFDAYRFEVIDGEDAVWTELLVTTPAGNEICTINRASGRLLAHEVDAVRQELAENRPSSAAHWIERYLSSARVLYGCRYLSFGYSKAYAAAPNSVMWAIQTCLGAGILHVEGQGFSNEDGYQITWEFSERVTGERQVAVLDRQGHWQTFEMDMADKRQRAAFRAGERPRGADLLEFN